jgi:hypothetical protein
MRVLSDSLLLQVWERGYDQHPLDRALTMLAIACPELSTTDLVSLTVGQRDAYLLDLRELTFGSKIDSFVECPNCQEKLEFCLNTRDLRITDQTQPKAEDYVLKLEEFELKFRLPNSQDLAAISGFSDPDAARLFLGQRCLLEVHCNGNPVDLDQIPSTIVSQLTEQMTAYDSQAEILIGLDCPACNHHWQALFDIVMFFWTEVSTQAKRLMRDVHALARFYGWREADILAMGAFRRKQYLNLIPDG